MNAIAEAMQTALQTTTAIDVNAALPVVETVPSAGKGKANEKALFFLREAQKEAVKVEQTVRDDIFNAAAECESLAEWVATVAVFRSEVRQNKATVSPTVQSYLSSITAGWEKAKDKATEAYAQFKELEKIGHDTDPYAGLMTRLDSRFPDTGNLAFLDPRAAFYKDAQAYWRDLNLVASLSKTHKAAMKNHAKGEALRAAAAGKDGGTVTPKGDTRQTGDLPADVQEALNKVIRAVHGNWQMYKDPIIDALLMVEHLISVEIPQEARAGKSN